MAHETPAQRAAQRAFWLAWAKRTQLEISVLLAETIDVTPPTNDVIHMCVTGLIDIEQQLAAVLGT